MRSSMLLLFRRSENQGRVGSLALEWVRPVRRQLCFLDPGSSYRSRFMGQLSFSFESLLKRRIHHSRYLVPWVHQPVYLNPYPQEAICTGADVTT
jgi:hypothetical protein